MQASLQAAVRQVTGSRGTFTEDLHAFCDYLRVPPAQLMERLGRASGETPQFALNWFLRNGVQGVAPWSLFATGAPGLWYDLSLTDGTLWQNAAGTIPAALEQPVGLVKDKSGRNNHAFQTTSANRPVLSARYNLLTKTENFGDEAWNAESLRTLQVSANATTAPNGTVTADKVVEAAAGAGSVIHRVVFSDNSASSKKTFSVYAKKAERKRLYLFVNGPSQGAWFDLDLGTCGAATDYPGGSAAISGPDAYGFYKCSLSPSTASGWYIQACVIRDSATTFDIRVGDGTSGIYIWGADLRVANDGVGLPPYQRVNTATDYDTAGFPLYLRFNGSTQFLQTNPIDFSSTDKVLVAAGVRKLSDSTAATVAELSANSGVTPNTFAMFAPGAVAPNYAFRSSGTLDSVAAATTFASPVTNVLVGLGEVASDTAILRINGTQAGQSTADQGTGNFGSYIVFIGARGGTSLFFDGRLYILIIAGIKPTDAQILGVETYINRLTRAF